MKKNKLITMKIVILLLFLVGLAVTSASSIIIINHHQKSKVFTPITAKVVEHKKKENGLKAIVIEYNINEKYYRITSKNYSKKPAKVDEEINIKYNPENPGDMIWIDNNNNKKYLSSGLILLVGSILMFVVFNFVDKKKNKSTKKKEVKLSETIELPIQKEVVTEIVDLPIEKKEEQTRTIEVEENVITVESPTVNDSKVTLDEEEITIESKKEEPIVNVEIVEVDPKVEPILPKIEQPKIRIPHQHEAEPPKEANTSNILDMTIAMPALNKEELTLELPIIKKDQ